MVSIAKTFVQLVIFSSFVGILPVSADQGFDKPDQIDPCLVNPFKELNMTERKHKVEALFNKSKDGKILTMPEQSFLRHHLNVEENSLLNALRKNATKEVNVFHQGLKLNNCNIVVQPFALTTLPVTKDKKSSGSICRMWTGNEPELQESLKYQKKCRQFRFLKRLDDNRCVAVVYLNKGQSPVLNPRWNKGILYGPIPELSSLTLDEADLLWYTENTTESSKSSIKSRNFRTYKLVSGYPSPGNKREYYFIDFVFKDNRVSKYRIRSNEITQSKWRIAGKKDREEILPI